MHWSVVFKDKEVNQAVYAAGYFPCTLGAELRRYSTCTGILCQALTIVPHTIWDHPTKSGHSTFPSVDIVRLLTHHHIYVENNLLVFTCTPYGHVLLKFSTLHIMCMLQDFPHVHDVCMAHCLLISTWSTQWINDIQLNHVWVKPSAITFDCMYSMYIRMYTVWPMTHSVFTQGD